MVGARVLQVALPTDLMNNTPFIHWDAARHALLLCSGPAIVVPVAKATTQKDNRIFNLIVGHNPTNTRCFAWVGFLSKLTVRTPNDLVSGNEGVQVAAQQFRHPLVAVLNLVSLSLSSLLSAKTQNSSKPAMTVNKRSRGLSL
jgi:hypothetical protein